MGGIPAWGGGLGVVLTTVHCKDDDYEIFHETSEFHKSGVWKSWTRLISLWGGTDGRRMNAVMKFDVRLSVLRCIC